MGFDSYKVRVPGSLMLFGEHAVLHGKNALVTAIDHYIDVKLTPRSDNKIEVFSRSLGDYSTSIDKFRITEKYSYVLTAVKQSLRKTETGFTLEIDSSFPSGIGFGSSAAVTVATLGVLNLWLDKKGINPLRIYQDGVRVVHLVQGVGSGADIAASVFGGIIAYKIKPVLIKKLNANLPMVAIYSGSKVPTKQVVAKVETDRKKNPNIYSQLYSAIDLCSKKAIAVIQKENWEELGKLMNIHQGLQDALGVNNKVLSDLIFSLRSSGNPVIYGAKISGSGLGDCVIGLGALKKNSFPKNKEQASMGIRQIDIKVSKVGIHEIK